MDSRPGLPCKLDPACKSSLRRMLSGLGLLVTMLNSTSTVVLTCYARRRRLSNRGSTRQSLSAYTAPELCTPKAYWSCDPSRTAISRGSFGMLRVIVRAAPTRIDLSAGCHQVPPQFKRGHREYSSPFSHDRAAKSVSGSAWTVGRTIAPGFRPRDGSDRQCSPGLHDFDFLVGACQAHHRKLKQRLANNHEWIEFEGTLLNQPLMGSYSNVDDTVLSVPGAPYRGVALRS